MRGAEKLLAELPKKLGKDVRVLRAPCMGACDRAPVVAVGHVQTFEATADKVAAATKKGAHAHAWHDHVGFDAYTKEGGYKLLKDCLDGKRTREEMIQIVSDAGLRGLGGAGFPTGRKWTFVRAEPAPRMMAVNGDEGEPGTFKDRFYLEKDPHRFIEGTLIAAWVVEAIDIVHLSARRISRSAADARSRTCQSREGGARKAYEAAYAPRRGCVHLR